MTTPGFTIEIPTEPQYALDLLGNYRDLPENKFRPDRVLLTRGAIKFFVNRGEMPTGYLLEHMAGNWGDVSKTDARQTDRDLKAKSRVLSVFTIGGERVWFMTMWSPDGKICQTDIMLPDEY